MPTHLQSTRILGPNTFCHLQHSISSHVEHPGVLLAKRLQNVRTKSCLFVIPPKVISWWLFSSFFFPDDYFFFLRKVSSPVLKLGNPPKVGSFFFGGVFFVFRKKTSFPRDALLISSKKKVFKYYFLIHKAGSLMFLLDVFGTSADWQVLPWSDPFGTMTWRIRRCRKDGKLGASSSSKGKNITLFVCVGPGSCWEYRQELLGGCFFWIQG